MFHWTMIAGLLKELLLQKPENLEILTLTPTIMEVETYRMLKLTHLGGETIFHFHDYCGRKSYLETVGTKFRFCWASSSETKCHAAACGLEFQFITWDDETIKKTSQNMFNPPSSSKKHLVSLLMMQQAVEQS